MLLGPLLYGEGHQKHIAGLRKAVLETMGPGGPAHTEFQDTYPRAMERQEGAGSPQLPREVTFVVMRGISPILRTHFS